jgi:hypothetical protein
MCSHDRGFLINALSHSVTSPDAPDDVDQELWPTAVQHWRGSLAAVRSFLSEGLVSLQDHLSNADKCTRGIGNEEAAQCWLEFGVACLRVFWQANVTGPTPAVPASPFEISDDKIEDQSFRVCPWPLRHLVSLACFARHGQAERVRCSR